MGIRKEPEILPLDEASMQNLGKWVAFKITARDGEGAISHGQVIKASKYGAEVSKALVKAHRENPGIETYFFVGGERRLTADEWRAELRKLAEAGENINARWGRM